MAATGLPLGSVGSIQFWLGWFSLMRSVLMGEMIFLLVHPVTRAQRLIFGKLLQEDPALEEQD